MNAPQLDKLRIDPARRNRPRSTFRTIVIIIVALILGAVFFAWPRKSDAQRVVKTAGAVTATEAPNSTAAPAPAPTPAESSDASLTVSGYIINRERIEVSPRFVGVVKWIGVKKGDQVKKDDVVVLLDDTEQQARVLEAEGLAATAAARVQKAQLDIHRAEKLQGVNSQQIMDDAKMEVLSAEAAQKQAEGLLAYARAQLEWTVIRAPIDGVVLEKLVDPGELVTPQSFGGTTGPSTAFLALADPNDLQVEIDVSEGDLAKIQLAQKCRVSPEAYPEKNYEGFVAEIAPEANRAKGTLQIKVQIKNPDRFLTPELSAKVEFLK